MTDFLAWIVGLYAPDDEHPSGNEGYVLDLPGTDAGDPDRDAALADALRPLLARLARAANPRGHPPSRKLRTPNPQLLSDARD